MMRAPHDSPRPTLFFALASEGMGHATRAAPVIEALRARGYRVEVFCGGRVAAYLRERIGHVNELFFVNLHYDDNVLDVWRSLRDGVARLGACLAHAWRFFLRVARERPVAIISDFEFVSAWIGWWTRTPLVALDNMHLVTHGLLPAPRTARELAEKTAVARAIAWAAPVVDKVLITSFWQPGLKPGVDPRRASFVPCAVRPEVLERRGRVRDDGPVLVYQTSPTNRDLPRTLHDAAARTGLRFVVYGVEREGAVGAVEYRAFSEARFLDDLAAAPFVIVNGGHSTIVEALALAKPILSEPIQRHYEQRANALGLEALGVGRAVDKLTADAIVSFAHEAHEMRERARLASAVVDNDALVAAVERALHELVPHRALPLLDAASAGAPPTLEAAPVRSTSARRRAR